MSPAGNRTTGERQCCASETIIGVECGAGHVQIWVILDEGDILYRDIQWQSNMIGQMIANVRLEEGGETIEAEAFINS